MKAIIVDSNHAHLTSEMRTELVEWARELGVDTKRATAVVALTESAAGGWRAHFSLKRQRNGCDYVEPGSNRVATDYNSVVVDLPPAGSWPQWFPDVEELPEMSMTSALELLDVAKTGITQISLEARRRQEVSA